MITLQEEFFRKHNFGLIVKLLLKAETPVELSLTGKCMHPFIRENDIVRVNPLKDVLLDRGDVILYFSINNKLQVHRYIKTIGIHPGREVLVRSDSKVNFDDPVPLSHVYGKVTLVQRGDREFIYETWHWRTINYLLSFGSPYIFKLIRIIKYFTSLILNHRNFLLGILKAYRI